MIIYISKFSLYIDNLKNVTISEPKKGVVVSCGAKANRNVTSRVNFKSFFMAVTGIFSQPIA